MVGVEEGRRLVNTLVWVVLAAIVPRAAIGAGLPARSRAVSQDNAGFRFFVLCCCFVRESCTPSRVACQDVESLRTTGSACC